jgi:hypothetical protein
MFGTLVVSLPSSHEVGQVSLKHKKNADSFDSSQVPLYDVGFAAWYSNVFHQVEKVTRGYRLVLTYNLVQKHSAMLLRAPEGTAGQRLSDLLRRHNDGLKSDNTIPGRWPNFLAHRLEHSYSEVGLQLSSLRGGDHDQVLHLKHLCDKLGFLLFFALKEKVLHKDDDCGSEVFDREESFKYVVDLEGHERPQAPSYNEAHILEEDVATDEEDHDESEHEGFTGNEGAPAQYWYRTGMVLIVPQSRKVDFMMETVCDKATKTIEMLQALKAQALKDPRSAIDSPQKANLERFCRLCANRSQEPSMYYSYGTLPSMRRHHLSLGDIQSASPHLEQVAITALEMGWFHIFQDIPMEVRFETSVLMALGKTLACCEKRPEVWVLLQEMLEGQVHVPTRLGALRTIDEGLAAVGAPETTKATLHDIAGTVLMSTLRSDSLLFSKEGGQPLVLAVVRFGEGCKEALLDKLSGCSTALKVAFILHLQSCKAGWEWDAEGLLGDAIARLWVHPFHLDDQQDQAKDS